MNYSKVNQLTRVLLVGGPFECYHQIILQNGNNVLYFLISSFSAGSLAREFSSRRIIFAAKPRGSLKARAANVSYFSSLGHFKM